MVGFVLYSVLTPFFFLWDVEHKTIVSLSKMIQQDHRTKQILLTVGGFYSIRKAVNDMKE